MHTQLFVTKTAKCGWIFMKPLKTYAFKPKKDNRYDSVEQLEVDRVHVYNCFSYGYSP